MDRDLHIFIDESGVFRRDPAKPQAIACVGAAIVPGRALGHVERSFRRLSEGWPRDDRGEVKGRLLGERQVADLCALLAPQGVLFAASVMDMNLIRDAALDRHRADRAARLAEYPAAARDAETAGEARRRRRTLERMHRQLYAQAVALTDVAWKAFRSGQLCYGRKHPGEPPHFRWVIDAKEKRRTTRYERWWRSSVAPLIRAHSPEDPAAGLGRGDGLAAAFGGDMVFAVPQAHVGLQIADILANALRRALMGHLRPAGWRPLGRLTVHRPEGAITLLRLGPAQGGTKRPYAQVIDELNRSGRAMHE